MAHGRRTSITIRLMSAERHTLMAWQRSNTIPAGLAKRARIILLLADGVPISHIADTVGIGSKSVSMWAKRFLQEGIEGLTDRPRRRSTKPDESRAYGPYHAGEDAVSV